jgi:hypothetical protein
LAGKRLQAFQVISQTPWPGNKVRVFFFGVQG